jgi:hypothetical protein
MRQPGHPVAAPREHAPKPRRPAFGFHLSRCGRTNPREEVRGVLDGLKSSERRVPDQLANLLACWLHPKSTCGCNTQ